MLDVCQYLIGVKRVKVTPDDCVWDFIAIVVSASSQLRDSFAFSFPLDRKNVKKQLDLAARPWSCIYILFFYYKLLHLLDEAGEGPYQLFLCAVIIISVGNQVCETKWTLIYLLITKKDAKW